MFPTDRWGLVDRYVELLATAGVERGLIGPREVPRLWSRHVLNCAGLAELIPAEASVADIGSGAGLPGLVVALARPDVPMTLIEPLLRRATFLSEAVDELGLGEQVSVKRARAEECAGKARYDVVTSRAVAPLGRLLGWSLPLVAPGGAVLAMKGSSAADEVAKSRLVWSGWGCSTPEVITIGAGLGEDARSSVVRVAGAKSAPIGLRDGRGRRERSARGRKLTR